MLELLIARALALRATEQKPDPIMAREILAAYRRARDGGEDLTPQDYELAGRAQEWLGRYDAAVAAYERAANLSETDTLELRKRILLLKLRRLDAPVNELHVELDEFIPQTDGRPDLLLWATELRIELLAREGRFEESLALLDELAPRYEPLPQSDQFVYLRALTLYRLGEYDLVEALLRDLRNRLTLRDQLDAKSGWLLGRTVLNDGGPQRPAEAVSIFRDIVSAHQSSVYAPACRLGMAEALAGLEHFEEALEQYSLVLEALPEYTGSPVLPPDAVRASLTVIAEELRQRDRYELALRFLEPAADLVDPDRVELASRYLERLGNWRALLAASLREHAERLPAGEDAEEKRRALRERSVGLFHSSADAFLELARINTLNEAKSAAATWRAAELLDETGDRARTSEVLQQFVRERPNNVLVPQALMKLGLALQAMGRYADAVEIYQEKFRRFPNTPDAGSSLIPLARCLIALGPERYDEAEKALRLVLEDSPLYTPEAPEFSDALFLLGDLLSRQERFEEAIPRLTEAQQRYPSDRRTLRAEFLLADAYRQSGLNVRADLSDPEFVAERERLKSEYVRRLSEAAALFGRLVQRFDDADERELDEMQALYLRLARLYEADCWYALGRYDKALKKYERAAWIYRNTPTALGAYSQIINCHRHQGEQEEARAALRRAQYLLKTIPASTFSAAVTGRRSEWQQYFNWIEHSELL